MEIYIYMYVCIDILICMYIFTEKKQDKLVRFYIRTILRATSMMVIIIDVVRFKVQVSWCHDQSSA